MSARTKRYLFSLIAVVAAVVILAGRRAISSRQLDCGPLSGIDLEYTVTAPGTPEQIVRYSGMTVSFNPSLHIPNWVAWELTADEANGTEPRAQKFIADEDVAGCADPWDYSYSGYDRGHMAPAADMKWSAEAMRQSFYMTNICPQAKALNSGAWRKLEEKTRQWAMADSAVVIVAGPVATPPFEEYIGDSRVAVPKKFFKVILAPYADPPRGIGFLMPNGRVPGGMQNAAVTIDSIEALTGHDFFSNLPDSIESVLESQCNFNIWSNRHP